MARTIAEILAAKQADYPIPSAAETRGTRERYFGRETDPGMGFAAPDPGPEKVYDPSIQKWVTPGQTPELMMGAFPTMGAGFLPKAAAVVGGLIVGAQALGLGEGEGLFGTDLLGGGGQPGQPMGGVPFVGPGLREPSAEYVVKEWRRRIDSREGDYNLQFYLVKMPGHAYRIYMYSQKTRGWKSWGLPRPAVIGKNMPSHKMLTRLRRNLKKQAADAKTILQVASPTAYAKQLGYRKPAHRHHQR